MRLSSFLSATSVAMFLNMHPASAVESRPFDGTWVWKKGAEELTLRLHQNGSHVTGTHLAIGQNGDKVDEHDQIGTPSIVGDAKGDRAEVNFKSGYPDSEGGGSAEILRSDGKLKWHILRSTGEHYFPSDALLRRK